MVVIMSYLNLLFCDDDGDDDDDDDASVFGF